MEIENLKASLFSVNMLSNELRTSINDVTNSFSDFKNQFLEYEKKLEPIKVLVDYSNAFQTDLVSHDTKIKELSEAMVKFVIPNINEIGKAILSIDNRLLTLEKKTTESPVVHGVEADQSNQGEVEAVQSNVGSEAVQSNEVEVVQSNEGGENFQSNEAEAIQLNVSEIEKSNENEFTL